jgi:hypothetical protein
LEDEGEFTLDFKGSKSVAILKRNNTKKMITVLAGTYCKWRKNATFIYI